MLVTLVQLMDRVPWPPEPATRPRGRPQTYADRLIVKALVIMMIRRLYTAYAWLTCLTQADPVAQPWRRRLHEHGRLPTRRTWARRLAALPPHLPGVLGCVGRHLGGALHPWAFHGRAAAVDSTPLNTRGGVWHKTHPETGAMPHTSIDTEAGGSTSGWHGWWYGWKRPVAVSVGAVWIPLAAELTAANTAANAVAPRLLTPLPAEVRDVLGDTHDNAPESRSLCAQSNRALLATRRGAYPHHDDGVEVRRMFHQRRSQAIEPFNGVFKTVFEGRTQLPVKGLRRSQLLALGAIVVYQWVWLYQHEHHLPLGKGRKPLLRAA